MPDPHRDVTPRRRGFVVGLVTAAVVLAGCVSPPDRARGQKAGDGTGNRPTTSATTGGAAQPAAARVARRSFSFAAAGDLGRKPATTRALGKVDASRARFFLALGDLDYDETPSDGAWCRYVHRSMPRKGARFPFEVLVGNHEQDGGPDGRIANFARCLPNRIASTVGTYGAQYAFTYPHRKPYAKFIMIAPHLAASGKTYRYEKGSPDRSWLVRQIDRARAAGIRWIVVGAHYPCISTGISHGCDAGPAVMNLLIAKKVDLVLTGHNHVFERSKQLAHSSRCRAVVPEHYKPGCVVGSGARGVYTKGSGTVQIVAGAVHGGDKGVDPRDGDHGYFAKTNGRSTGFMSYTVTPTRLRGRWVSTGGGLRDSFEIVKR